MSGRVACVESGSGCPVVQDIPRWRDLTEEFGTCRGRWGTRRRKHEKDNSSKTALFVTTLKEYWRRFLDNLNLTEDDIRGAVVLDAGCGPGRYTRQLGEHGARLVVGLDINEAVDEAFETCRGVPNVEIVQGNVFEPPFKPHSFDLVNSVGVLHRTPRRRHSAPPARPLRRAQGNNVSSGCTPSASTPSGSRRTCSTSSGSRAFHREC